MSEQMDPVQLQQLLNGVFSRLTRIIRSHRGTIDKYMGDCVMAFWGAPVAIPNHAELAVRAALEMGCAVEEVNYAHRDRGLPEIGIGIGIHTGIMCVGDMGSDIRRSYTVIGDAVNLGSRLEGLSKTYGVEIVASEATRAQAMQHDWQELDLVRVKGKAQAIGIHTPWGHAEPLPKARWEQLLAAYRAQDWAACQELLQQLLAAQPPCNATLHALYTQRVNARAVLPYDSHWDGATNFDSK